MRIGTEAARVYMDAYEEAIKRQRNPEYAGTVAAIATFSYISAQANIRNQQFQPNYLIGTMILEAMKAARESGEDEEASEDEK